MREFKEYQFRCCKSCTVESCIDMCAGCIEMQQRKIGWEAVLEQILTKVNPYESDAENFRTVYDFIREKLEQ